MPIVARMKRSTARIMGLVDDVLDFARGRLGGGIPVHTSDVPDDPARRRAAQPPIVSPPSTGRITPVIKLESASEARNT
jgi:hypothetical protein